MRRLLFGHLHTRIGNAVTRNVVAGRCGGVAFSSHVVANDRGCRGSDLYQSERRQSMTFAAPANDGRLDSTQYLAIQLPCNIKIHCDPIPICIDHYM